MKARAKAKTQEEVLEDRNTKAKITAKEDIRRRSRGHLHPAHACCAGGMANLEAAGADSSSLLARTFPIPTLRFRMGPQVNARELNALSE